MGRKKLSKKESLSEFVGLRLSEDTYNWLLKHAYKQKTKITKIIRKIINNYIASETMQQSLRKLNINVKQINEIGLLEEK